MMRQTITQTGLSLTVTLIGLIAAAPAAAQGSTIEDCAKLVSDAERLACFDSAVEERTDAAPETGETSAPTPVLPSPAATATQAPPEVGAPPEPPADAGQSVTEVPAEIRESPRQPDEQRAVEPDSPWEYQAVVIAMYKRPHGQMAVTLDNGEVWSEQFASRAFLVDVGDAITMKQSRFSKSYRLVAPGGRGYKMTRLK